MLRTQKTVVKQKENQTTITVHVQDGANFSTSIVNGDFAEMTGLQLIELGQMIMTHCHQQKKANGTHD